MFDALVILLQSIVEGAVGSVEHLTAQGLANRMRVGVMPIGRHPLWLVTYNIGSLRERALGSIQISLLAHHRINEIAIPIDSAIEVAPFPFDVHVRFIDVARLSRLSTSRGLAVDRHEWGKTGFSVSNCLMGELKASLQKHLGKTRAGSACTAAATAQRAEHIGGVLQKVERSSRALGDWFACTALAAERSITQQRFPFESSPGNPAAPLY